MTKNEIRKMYQNGEGPMDILTEVVLSGVEYPDAVFKVKDALNLDEEAVAEMEADYDECI